MQIFGLEISWATKATPENLQAPFDRGNWWWPVIRESFTGAWQRNVTIEFDSVMAHHAVFACQTLIASDISKLRVKLIERDASGVWTENENSANTAHAPVLRKPNHFQTRNQFWEYWILSKLTRGNTYVLKERDDRNVVRALYVLDPTRTKPLVAPNGDVYYELRRDDLSGVIPDSVTVPASEIIHDRFNCLFHPLVGLSPIYANGLTATQALNIQKNATNFFQNSAMPGGILIAPGAISDTTASRLKEQWETNYMGPSASGRVAVLGDGLKFERMSLTSVESQMVEQLRWSSEVICSTYHVPPYKIGVGPMPSHNNVQALNVEYYSQCLQALIEAVEVCLDEGMSLPADLGIEFDLDGLLRMDSVTQMDVLDKAVKAAVYSPNEARQKLDKKPVKGGESPMIQQQNYSLEALAKRDAKEDPFATETPALPPPAEEEEGEEEVDERSWVERFYRIEDNHARL